MTVRDNAIEALLSIKSNLLRAILTLLIIAVGIACLVGILSAIDAILFTMSDNFNRLGANNFGIRPADETIKTTKEGQKTLPAPPISIDEALRFKDLYKVSGASVAIYSRCNNDATVKYGDEKTNPNVSIIGIDENYFTASSIELEFGRPFSMYENNKIILGKDIVKMLFDDKSEKAIGKDVILDGDRYEVIGVIKSKGSGSGGGGDRIVYIPLVTAKNKYHYEDKNYSINVAVQNAVNIENNINDAIGIFRTVRKLRAIEENDFEIKKSDSVLEKLKSMTSTLRLGTAIIAILTLLGASIGLMNIMLVSVTERTKEIGVRKALGATSNNVLLQFLTEAIVICLIGGIVGILLGIMLSFGVTLLVNGRFIIPWLWMLVGLLVCIFVGVVSGLYPALKASKLDPIESLRYE